MKWKTFQRIYRELVAENLPFNKNIIIRYVNDDKQKGSITCKIKDFKRYAWEVYEKKPIVVIIGVETKRDVRQLFKYILCKNPEEIPSPNDNYFIKCFSYLRDESKNVITEILMRQISSHIGDMKDGPNNTINKNL